MINSLERPSWKQDERRKAGRRAVLRRLASQPASQACKPARSRRQLAQVAPQLIAGGLQLLFCLAKNKAHEGAGCCGSVCIESTDWDEGDAGFAGQAVAELRAGVGVSG